MKAWKKGTLIGVIWGALSWIGFYALLGIDEQNKFLIMAKMIILPVSIVSYISIPISKLGYGNDLFGTVILFLPFVFGGLIGGIIGYIIDKRKSKVDEKIGSEEVSP